MKSTLQICILSFLPFFSNGQMDIYEWGEGLTYYTGKIDTTKYTFEEIDLIYKYLHARHSDMIGMGNIWKIEQMDTATAAPIDQYYKRTLHVLETMKIPERAFWDSLVLFRKRELYEVCEDNRLFILTLKDPALLFKYHYAECKDAIHALNGDADVLLNAWFELKERQKLNNCCPDVVEKKYQSKFNSPQRLKHARLELMTYDWGNCMNQFVYYHDDSRIEGEFQKLFLSVLIEEEED